MSVVNFLKNIRIGLGILSKSKNKPKKCPFCGHPFKEVRGTMRVCSEECKEKLFSMSQKKRMKLMRKYKENPTRCPVCGRKNKTPISKSIGTFCIHCGKFIRY